MARKAGSRNLGFFYRTGRGWYAQANGKMIPLCGEGGEPLRRKATHITDFKEARMRMIPAKPVPVNGVTVQEVCYAYLEKAKSV